MLIGDCLVPVLQVAYSDQLLALLYVNAVRPKRTRLDASPVSSARVIPITRPLVCTTLERLGQILTTDMGPIEGRNRD